LANHKSAIKRSRQNQVRRARNRSNRTAMKTAIKKVMTAVEQNAAEDAQAVLREAISIIQRTAGKGTIHKKTASRKISRLTKRVNALASA
jgi:small subunit ribosomal protein S20